MNIGAGEVERIAKLARLSITDEEKKVFGAQLGNILGYIEKLNELDTSGIQPTSHVLELSDVMRDDSTWQSLSPVEALANAPDRSRDFYRVPQIIEGD